jgi:tetratricopeptide (TPR) repeat protein
LYAAGNGVPQDYGKAREWFEKAAARGDSAAMVNLGLLHANGHGVVQDYSRAREWYRRARKNLEETAVSGDQAGESLLGFISAIDAFADRRFSEAVNLQEVIVSVAEGADRKKYGKLERWSASAYSQLSWYKLYAKDFEGALGSADKALSIKQDYLSATLNKANALLFLNRLKDARTTYLANKGKTIEDRGLWEDIVLKEFALLEAAGLTNPRMAEIRAALVAE